MRVTRRERSLLAATAAAAIVVPVGAAAWLHHRVDGTLAPAIGRAAGQHVTLGGVEAGLSGDLRLRDVVVGDLLAADAVEAAVSLDSLLAGELTADEIRVIRPRVRVHVGADGRSDWHELLQRFARRKAGAGAARARTRLRRVVVSGGDLVADVAGVRVTARDVELHPQAGGVRLVTGAVELAGTRGPYTLRGDLARVGADVRLPGLAIERLVAVGGRAALAAGDHSLTAAGVDVHRDGPGRPWQASAVIDDRGAPRRIEVATRAGAGAGAVAITAERIPLAILAPLAPAGLALDGARASGTVTVAAAPAPGTAWLAADVTVDGAVVRHPSLADAPVTLDGAVAIEARLAPGRAELTRLAVGQRGLVATGEGWVRWARGRVVAADARLAVPPIDCRRLIDALPPALRGPLDELVVRGTIAGAAHVGFDLDDPGADGVALDVELDPRTCQVVADAPSADPRALAGAAEHSFPDGHRATVGPGLPGWVDPFTLPAHVRGAFVAAEDARFWDHRGFDLVQIARSLEVDLREDRFARGGSTISQQLVKNAFLHHRRTLARKLQEAVLTWRLEAVLDKRTILARYLNVVELGPGVYGLAAGAHHWFGKPAADLTVREAAFLAALTPAPRTMAARLLRARGLDPETRERVEVTLRAMRRAAVIDAATARAAFGARLDLRPAAVGR
ncbi:MAG TPA: biosynthetic peptidoglycan transglycosylase [Kofleriaceae bacterium]|nr:biosynthetic peptidoglycan transglycosylase [Kofleriaceae bacterium]